MKALHYGELQSQEAIGHASKILEFPADLFVYSEEEYRQILARPGRFREELRRGVWFQRGAAGSRGE